MTDMAFDANDVPGLVAYILGSAMTYGWVNPELPLIGPINRNLTSFAVDGYTTVIGVGTVLAVLGLIGIMATNNLGLRGWSLAQGSIFFVTLWLIITPPFIPIMAAFISLTWGQIIAFLITTITVGTLGIMG